jgi:hypothetical protein
MSGTGKTHAGVDALTLHDIPILSSVEKVRARSLPRLLDFVDILFRDS